MVLCKGWAKRLGAVVTGQRLDSGLHPDSPALVAIQAGRKAVGFSSNRQCSWPVILGYARAPLAFYSQEQPHGSRQV